MVFAGKGVAELQEGGWIPINALAGAPRVDFLGVYPTVETILAQGVLVALLLYALLVMLWRRRRLHTTQRAPADLQRVT
jgi:high-affinity iron transporter